MMYIIAINVVCVLSEVYVKLSLSLDWHEIHAEHVLNKVRLHSLD